MQIASGDNQPPISLKERCLHKFHVIVLVLIDFHMFLNKESVPILAFLFFSCSHFEDFNYISLQ